MKKSKEVVVVEEEEEEEEEYEVEAITDFDGKLYTVKWKGYSETTKEPLENLKKCQELLDQFHKEREKNKSWKEQHVIHIFYNRGNGSVIFNTPKGRKVRTFKESLNTDPDSVIEYLEEYFLANAGYHDN